MPILYGFIPLGNVWTVMRFYNGLVYVGFIVSFGFIDWLLVLLPFYMPYIYIWFLEP